VIFPKNVIGTIKENVRKFRKNVGKSKKIKGKRVFPTKNSLSPLCPVGIQLFIMIETKKIKI